MKYLVTGGEGFIGSKIVERLNCNSYDKKSGQDILNQEKLVKSLKDINTVFHTAAKISVPESQKKPEEYYDVNVKGTKNIVNLSESKIIFSSSAAVYGEYDRKVVEEDKLNPESNYAQNKVDGEELISAKKEISLRYFNVYGPGQGAAGVIAIFIKKALNNEDLVITGNGDQERDFIYVDDVVDANIAAVSYSGSEKVFNIGSGQSIKLRDLAKLIIKLCNSESKIILEKPRHGDLFYSCADITKAKNELNWMPKTDLETGLKKTIDFYK
ncbi:NAD-dependent epimerase/dehydratase family protein [Candidatus Woesearchaeota archaeon]|jgi:UDP-glucose 4-epimerase|nr:NAD-dependent epimerase/dehydratase family protein [Candidatus Woesearchaeota archaeon]